MAKFYLLSMVVFLCSCASHNTTPAKKVTIRDSSFNIVKILNTHELTKFNNYWLQKEVVDAPFKGNNEKHYKLDVSHGDHGGRWLYITNGLVRFLDVWAHKVYKIQSPEEFNQLIGAE